jgi:hypothetical protein
MSAPGVPSPQEKAEMERLRRIMNGDIGMSPLPAPGLPQPTLPQPIPQPSALPTVDHGDPGYYPELYGHQPGHGGHGGYEAPTVAPPAMGGYATDQDTLAMKSILSKMYAADAPEAPKAPAPVPVMERAEPARPPRPAARTAWRVSARDNKTFDVVHPSGDSLIRGLSLRETAVSLAKLMNRGLYLNHESIRRVLDLDESYAAKRREAVGFQKRVRSLLDEGDQRAARILEKTYRKAREDALAVKTKLARLAEAV